MIILSRSSKVAGFAAHGGPLRLSVKSRADWRFKGDAVANECSTQQQPEVNVVGWQDFDSASSHR